MRPNKPFETSEAANAAIHQLYSEVKQIRDKLGLHDVLIVVRSEVASGDEVTAGFSYQEMGEFMAMESLAAWAFGKLQSERKELLAKFLGGKV